ncbi:class I adenylate-forming enzyme family protein [Pseudonocardia parietis]|uniref:Acyl-CoA synthetase (AMP-forming)/AMP-acid ligase II n=1 Tax=Pseudonocardia parietis TaxID=570936 RepID=A0ABS4W3U9_9PSEU|nr:class I adenylate-forming enzyme family protein [Pseudonocardia parietis]MBP2370359.1 acyl-CoA synthetase (AMP-forming)/AMP-acid ligase II [Pseudonocardia parietis]
MIPPGMPTLPGMLREVAAAHPDAGVVAGEQRASWPRVLAGAEALAARFVDLGVPSGGRVALLAGNTLTGIELLFACGLAGAVAVPVNTRFGAPEVCHLLGDSGADTVVVTADEPEHLALLRAALDSAGPGELSGLRRIVLVGSAPIGEPPVGEPGGRESVIAESMPIGARCGTDPHRLADHATEHGPGGRELLQHRIDDGPGPPAPDRAVGPDDVALLVYTSGTTAHPRGCRLTHRTLVEGGRAVGRERFRCTPSDVLWDVLPLFHLSFVNPLLAILDAGGTFVTERRFEAGAALARIRDEGVTVAFTCFPTVMDALLAHPDVDRCFAGVRLMLNVGPPETLRAVQARLPGTVQLTSYGSTETAGIAVTTHPDDPDDVRLGTNGFPLPGVEVAVADPDTGTLLPAGEPGELLVRGTGMFTGYHDGAPHGPEDWFPSGDLGLVDAAGRVHYRGRLKDMIKVGGENVAALEVEAVLATHPAVHTAAVVPAPDPRYTEIPAAFVELRAGAEVTPAELRDHCAASLAAFKVPRHIRFVTDWPMSATKIQKGPLRERITIELEELV